MKGVDDIQGENSHVHGPLGVAIVSMGRRKGTNVVRLAVVVPGNDLNEARTEMQDLPPTLVPQEI